VLAIFELSDSQAASQVSEDLCLKKSAYISLPPQRTISDWVDDLTEGGVVEKINNQLIKWVTAFLDKG
jgi:uncharacterized protein YbcC (UPF0753/DUF2309 family)